MKTSNAFKSKDHIFRQTAMSAALTAAGVTVKGRPPIHLVRESRLEGLLKAKHDKHGNKPSVSVPISAAPVEHRPRAA